MDLSELEALALGTDRAAALATLLPGTAEHDYWRGVFLQHEGRLAEVDEILSGWRDRHKNESDDLFGRLRKRQLLAKVRVDLPGIAKHLARETGTRLDDRAEVVVQAERFPTRLDPARIDRRVLLADATKRRPNLEDVTDEAIPDILRDPTLIPGFEGLRRAILQRLRRTDLPGVVELIVADLTDKNGSNGSFGALPIHLLLTRAQLDTLAERLPYVKTQSAWVDAMLRRLAPPSWVDVRVDSDERARLIDRASAFATTLAPAFNTLKATLLYHRLVLDRAAGIYDRALFRAYIALPRSADWIARERLRSFPTDGIVQPNAHVAAPIGLEPIGNDEPLVRDYLARFLLEEDAAAYSDLLDRDWLAKLMATARLLAGAGAAEAKILSAAERDALRDRVDIELAPQNRPLFGASDDVVLEVDVKNVRALEVKVFRIDALAYWLAKNAEVGLAIDLDGMVPSGQEETLTFDHPPIRRHRVKIALAACKRPGTYVVELVGNGRSSRALLRKGALRHLQRTSAAGTVVTVTDEDGQPLPDARLWLGGRELVPGGGGSITIPFATGGGNVEALLVHGDVVQRATIARPSETPSFSAGFHVERESFVANQTARVLCRPRLALAGAPASLALLEDTQLDITVTTLTGSTKRTQPVTLRDEEDVAVDINVPDGATELRARLRGRLRIMSRAETIDVADETAQPVNGIHASQATAMLYLARVALPGGDRFVLSLLGKTGEPLAGRPVALQLHHRDVVTPVEATLETDADGAIDLGAIDGTITRVVAVLRSQIQRSWSLLRPSGVLPRTLQVLAGDPVVVPRPEPAEVVLFELRAGAVTTDMSGHLSLGERTIRIEGLPPGDYWLASRRGGTTTITVAPRVAIHAAPAGAAAQAWVRAGAALLELRPPVPIVEHLAVENDALVVRIASPTPATRVHLVATRFLPDPVLATAIAGERPLLAARGERAFAQYVSGRDIGDEYRYVLERRSAPRRPGMMLEKPSLLLHPWALRTTTTGRQEAAAGSGYGNMPPPAPAMAAAPMRPMSAPKGGARAKMAKEGAAEPVEIPGFSTLDFMPAGAIVRANLRPGADGVVRVPLDELDGQTAQVFVVDPALAAPIALEISLPARPLRARDLRLQLALDPARHFTEQRRIEGVPADTTLVVPDVRTGKLELVSTVARAHQILATLLDDASALTEFAFVAEWPTLDEKTRRARYSKYACHELNLFLWRKDPAFFAAVVKPSLADKREKTFVDRFLLGEDLASFVEPWAFGRLNAVERALLAIALPALRAGLARLMGDEVDVIPPDPERDARLVTTLLGVAALDVEAPAEPAPAMAFSGGAARAGGFAGPPGFAADVLERSHARLFRGAEKTMEWAERQWWERRLEATYDRSFAEPNRFWRDLTAHIAAGSNAPFLSPHLGDCAGSFAEAMCALAFLDLPFVAAAPVTALEDVRLTVTPRSHALAARSSIAEIPAATAFAAVLVGQSYVRADDRWEWVGNEQREKRVTGPMLVGVVYRCHVVVTNPTGVTEKLDLLMQIPKGAMPVDSGFITRTVTLGLEPYGTKSLDYAFYFPLAGSFTHFPAHVTRAGALLVAAPAQTLEVVRELPTVDTASWSHVAQHGTLAEVLALLDRSNIGRLELDRIAWRMHDREAFTRVTALLTTRHVYEERLWRYALLHHDASRVAEWLRHNADLFGELDPVAVGDYQHLEYAPLINARAHRLGAEQRILNDALATQYHAFLDLVGHRPTLTADDLLTAAHYLLAMDRVEDAMRILARVDPPSISARTQFDYLSAYVACYRGDLPTARRLASAWLSHPVDRWRQRFEALVQMLDEVDGKAVANAPIDADSRDQHMAAAAAVEPALDLAVSGNDITLSHANLGGCQLRFFKLDIELLFSRQPFVQGDVERFSFIEPGFAVDVPFGPHAQTTVPIPPALRGANLVIEAVAPGLRCSVAHYAHDLGVQVAHGFGQVRVVRASTGAPLPAVYVKVYSRERGGRVVFYKDGYTDLRGRLDYATLSTDDLDRVERFAILVASDDAGATITEAPPPAR